MSGSPNKLLARVPLHEYKQLLPHLQTIELRQKRLLLSPYLPASKVYFPGGGVCSITVGTTDGEMAGVGLVGNEGIIGFGAGAEDPESGEMATVEIGESVAQVMDIQVFRREMGRLTTFSQLVQRYAMAFSESLMQSVACNALHSVEQRCARCLLDIRDRIGGDELPLSQETLAVMLGVRRATVTLAASALQRVGLIDHGHRRIVLRDRKKLEKAACECYAIVKGHFARLLV